MKAYTMHAYEIAVPDSSPDPALDTHTARMRRALKNADFDGWTEYRHNGAWHGEFEEGTTFVIYAYAERFNGKGTLRTLCELARWAMPGETAIQIVDKGLVTLAEA